MCVLLSLDSLFVLNLCEMYFFYFLKVYRYEKADGAGRAQDIIVQGFIRFATMGILPVVFSAGVLYLLVRDMVVLQLKEGGREGGMEGGRERIAKRKLILILPEIMKYYFNHTDYRIFSMFFRVDCKDGVVGWTSVL